ncbi:hypothetical protein AMECASPLE_039522 [Ameca splendens]|uniref:Uncharacterized protein n=1 Tax=Ameca splendens TaxID=208324 RepID=A0ABV0YKL2_9TELE
MKQSLLVCCQSAVDSQIFIRRSEWRWTDIFDLMLPSWFMNSGSQRVLSSLIIICSTIFSLIHLIGSSVASDSFFGSSSKCPEEETRLHQKLVSVRQETDVR